MKKFSELSSRCTYRDKQMCTYWDRETQCHQLSCPIISKDFYDQTELSVPKQIIKSMNNFDSKYLDKNTTISPPISENTQTSKPNEIFNKDPLIKETQGQTVVAITPKKTEAEVSLKYNESANEIKITHDDINESVNQDLTKPNDFKQTEALLQQPKVFQKRQETIVITPRQIKCDRCGDPINTETCTSIRDPTGDIFYIHPNGRCRPGWDKIQEVRKKWLKKRK